MSSEGKKTESSGMKTNVFILGAGFSAKAGLPVMSNFIQKARDYYFNKLVNSKEQDDQLIKTKFELIEDYINKIHSVKAYLNIDLHNVENIYSLIDMEQKIGSIDEDKLEAIKYFIWKTIEYSTPKFTDNQKYLEYTQFLKFIFKKQSKNIIMTFNYDLIVEYALLNLGYEKAYKFGYPGFNSKIAKIHDVNFNNGSRYDLLESEAAYADVRIIKLHGSINWFGEGDLPIIVPPSWRKGEEQGNIIDEVWKEAYQTLIEANNICFIGYSMPETDSYFKNLLALSLAKSKKLEEIVVVDADDSGETKNRYRKIIDNNFADKRSGKGFNYYGHKFDDIVTTTDKHIARWYDYLRNF